MSRSHPAVGWEECTKANWFFHHFWVLQCTMDSELAAMAQAGMAAGREELRGGFRVSVSAPRRLLSFCRKPACSLVAWQALKVCAAGRKDVSGEITHCRFHANRLLPPTDSPGFERLSRGPCETFQSLSRGFSISQRSFPLLQNALCQLGQMRTTLRRTLEFVDGYPLSRPQTISPPSTCRCDLSLSLSLSLPFSLSLSKFPQFSYDAEAVDLAPLHRFSPVVEVVFLGSFTVQFCLCPEALLGNGAVFFPNGSSL